MPGTGKTFLVAGAGIAGLTLALALAKFGANVIVLERKAAPLEFGAGLQISPNARKVLDRLGLDDAVRAASLEPTGLDLYPVRARHPLLTLELGSAMRSRFGAPYVVMHRADLLDLLHKATRPFANIDIQFGVGNRTAQSHDGGVTLSWDTAGQQRTGRALALIGADGVHSHTRTSLLQGPAAQFHGRLAWRVLLPFAALRSWIALDRVSVLFGRNYHVVCYPLSYRNAVNVALFAKGSPDMDEVGGAPALDKTGDARLDAILAAAGQGWTPWPMYAVETPAWHKGNIGIIGDAAHAMLPFQAQGAAMGIEDAAILAPLLVSEPSAEAAFARFETIRQARVRRVAKTSRSNGAIFHLGWPLSVARNAVIVAQGGRGHLRRLAWLYGYDPHEGR